MLFGLAVGVGEMASNATTFWTKLRSTIATNVFDRGNIIMLGFSVSLVAQLISLCSVTGVRWYAGICES